MGRLQDAAGAAELRDENGSDQNTTRPGLSLQSFN